MSMKMKRATYDSSSHALDKDARARFKHQSLLQDYLELQQETESAKRKLMAMKRKKLTLQAEVSFLRRRHRFLLKTKSSSPMEQVTANPHHTETTQIRKGKKEKVNSKKEPALCNLPPTHKQNQKGRVYTEKKNAPRGIRSSPFDLNRKESRQWATQVSNPNQRVRTDGVNETLLSEYGKKESTLGGKEGIVQNRAPMIDLNQISREEEELQESYEQAEGLTRNGVDEQNSDVKLSVCRNLGDASTSRAGKRKISWQDPVALRV